MRQRRESKCRNNGVRESTSEEDEKYNQSIQLGVYQLCMASILFLGKKRWGIGSFQKPVYFSTVYLYLNCGFAYIVDH